MSDYVRTEMQVAWVQPNGPNTDPVAVPCAVIDSLSQGFGTVEPTYCFNTTSGKYEVISRNRSAPDPITFDWEELMGLTASELEKAFRRDCPVPVYVGTYTCAPRQTFAGFERMKVVQDCLLETAAENTLMQRDGISDSMETMTMSASAIEKAFQLDAYRKTTAEDQILRDIAKMSDPACFGECGPDQAICDELVIACNAVGAGTANVLFSTDGGDTWAAGAVDPFIADEDVASVVAFPINQTTWRVVAACGTTKAAPPEVSYSDDSGASWTGVNLGAVNAGFMLHGSSMFALDMYHIWVVDNAGSIWFSSNGAASFTEQVTTNTLALYGIYFMDANRGCAVGGSGAANVLLTTTDGGTNWTITNTIAAAATFVPYAVTMHDENVIFLVGIDAGGAGELWYSNDAGATWTQRTIPLPTGMTSVPALFDIERRDRYCMFMAGEAQVGGVSYGTVYRTVNGGTDWEVWLSVALDATGAGFQALTTCSYNQCFAVGDLETTSAIYEVTD